VLIEQAVDDERGLRLAESAGYNLREALDAVVVGRTPAGQGLPAILQAWDRYESARRQPGEDGSDSFTALQEVLRRVADNRDRSSYHAARLLDYLRVQTGVDPLPGERDPIGEYSRLRQDANTAVHAEFALDAVTALYERTIAWFIRMFNPPGDVVDALRDLAGQPWRGPEQIERLRELATNPHHMRLFLGQLGDPSWLVPLYQAGLIGLPLPDAAWPVTGLLDGIGRVSPGDVAAVLRCVLADSNQLPREQQLGARFELLRMASQLGVAGYPVVARVAALHPESRAVCTLAVGVVRQADPADSVVAQVADAVLAGKRSGRDDYHVRVVLDQLCAGIETDNAVARTRMMAAKVRRAAAEPDTRFIALDIAALTADLDDEYQYLVIVAHYLARLLARAAQLGVSTAELLDWTGQIPGEIGERITCRILADTSDVPLRDKISHVALRLASPTVTGDDRDLVDSILSANPEPGLLAVWVEALSTPSPAPADSHATPPRDWARAWRWSLVLPADLLTDWQDPIARVTERYGPPSPQTLDRRSTLPLVLTGQSAYREDQLSGLPVLQAADLVASWRPDAASDRDLVGARELARTLQAVVKNDPDRWSTDAVTVVRALREPVYVLHYFNALIEQAAQTAPRGSLLLDAATLARTARWEPTILGRDDFDFEPDWHNVDTATVDLAAALANNDADLTGHLDAVWTWAGDLVDLTADANSRTSAFEGHDALTRAINTPGGRGLQAALALAGWELRHYGTVQPRLASLLDEVVRVPGPVGMEYRAILAERRANLEAIAPDWLETNAATLFSDDDTGRETFDLTLKYGRPTPWFYRHFSKDLFTAARRDAENAVALLLLAMLHHETGYTIDAVITGLRGHTTALATSVNEVAFLVQSCIADDPYLAAAIEFWQALLDAGRRVVPPEALRSSGRWAFVTALPDQTWERLTLKTLELTNGTIDMPIEVADRCKNMQPSDRSNRIIFLMLGKGEPWEQHYVAQAGIETLKSVAADQLSLGENFRRLQTRLIQLGYHEAAEMRRDV